MLIPRTLRKLLASRHPALWFFEDRGGNFAVIAALGFVPVALAGIGAVDIQRAMTLRSEIQSAADAAALAAAALANTTPAQRAAEAEAVFAANLAFLPDPPTGVLKKVGADYVFATAVDFRTSALKLVALDTIRMNVKATASDAQQDLDVVFVLDSSGSMRDGNRLIELKKAVKLFLGNFDATLGRMQAALVPFDSQVHVETVGFPASANDYVENPYASDACHLISDAGDRAACEAAQEPETLEINCSLISNYGDRSRCAPEASGFWLGSQGTGTTALYSSLFYAIRYTSSIHRGYHQVEKLEFTFGYLTGRSIIYRQPAPLASQPVVSKGEDVNTANNDLLIDPGTTSWKGCFIDRTKPYDTQDDPAVTSKPETRYPNANCATGTLLEVQSLTRELETIKSKVDQMEPSGATNVTIGVQWGMEVFSDAAPFAGARDEADHIMIVLSDGKNTQNRWDGTGYAGQNQTVIDRINARTKLACQNAKAADIEIFTINLVEGDSDVLRECASEESKYYAVKTASDLGDVFGEIASRIKTVRLLN